jgi:hypothetical protein
MLAREWGTELLAGDELYGPMATVRLPGSRKVGIAVRHDSFCPRRADTHMMNQPADVH